MSTLSLPSHSFASPSPFSAAVITARRWGRSAWAALTEAPRQEPRSVEDVRAWAHSIEAHQPAFAAELLAIASRSAD